MENNKIPVNDGKGLLDNVGMCDSLANDLNILVKDLTNGDYLKFCFMVAQMTTKLSNLKKGIQNDTNSLKHNIEELKRIISELQSKEGVNNGTD